MAMKLYKTYILPLIEYGSVSFIAAPKQALDKLQKVQDEAIRICLNLPRYIRTDLIHEYACLDFVKKRLQNHNVNLLKTMTKYNEDIQNLLHNHRTKLDIMPKSPLDILDP